MSSKIIRYKYPSVKNFQFHPLISIDNYQAHIDLKIIFKRLENSSEFSKLLFIFAITVFFKFLATVYRKEFRALILEMCGRKKISPQSRDIIFDDRLKVNVAVNAE